MNVAAVRQTFEDLLCVTDPAKVQRTLELSFVV